MIDALINGKLHKQPESKTGKSGKPYVTALVRTAQQDGSIVFARVTAFDAEVCSKLAALAAGDTVALSGAVTLTAYTDKDSQAKPGMDMIAHALLTVYHVKHKRDAMQASPPQQSGLKVPAMRGES